MKRSFELHHIKSNCVIAFKKKKIFRKSSVQFKWLKNWLIKVFLRLTIGLVVRIIFGDVANLGLFCTTERLICFTAVSCLTGVCDEWPECCACATCLQCCLYSATVICVPFCNVSIWLSFASFSCCWTAWFVCMMAKFSVCFVGCLVMRAAWIESSKSSVNEFELCVATVCWMRTWDSGDALLVAVRTIGVRVGVVIATTFFGVPTDIIGWIWLSWFGCWRRVNVSRCRGVAIGLAICWFKFIGVRTVLGDGAVKRGGVPFGLAIRSAEFTGRTDARTGVWNLVVWNLCCGICWTIFWGVAIWIWFWFWTRCTYRGRTFPAESNASVKMTFLFNRIHDIPWSIWYVFRTICCWPCTCSCTRFACICDDCCISEGIIKIFLKSHWTLSVIMVFRTISTV